MKKPSLVDEYLNISKESVKKYGSKTVTFIQAGSFYEVYDYDRNSINFEICEKLLNIRITKKHSAEGRKDSAFMAGVPDHSFKKYEKLLVSNQYTVVYVDQVSQNPITRKVTKVISPGCGMDDDENKESILASCLLEQINNSWYLSVSTFDSNRGDTKILNTFVGQEFALTHIFEIIDNVTTKENVNEILFNIISSEIIKIPDFSKNLLIHKNFIKPKEAREIYLDINSYIPKMLQKIFPKYKTVFVDIIDSLGLSDIQATDMANMIMMLQFIDDHEHILIENLKRPVIVSESKSNEKIRLMNNVLIKLQIISQTDDNSLFSVLNKTLTCAGKKKLHGILMSPSCDIHLIEKRYDSIDFFLNNKELLEYTKNNLKLLDLERIYRKFAIGKIDPHNEIHKIFIMNNRIINLLEYIFKFKNYDSLYWVPTIELLEKFKVYTNEISDVFNIENCEKGDGCVFKKGIINHIDDLWDCLEGENKLLENLRKKLTGLINDNINLKYTDKDGYFFETTKKRGQKLELELKNNTTNDKELEQIKVSYLSSQAKITSCTIKKFSDKILIFKSKIEHAHREETTKFVVKWYQEYYEKVICHIIDSMSWLDVFYSCTLSTIQNNYVRPKVKDETNSSLKAVTLRHPIIELLMINDKNKYIPNDVDISSDNSYLIYGVNSVGKSSLLKSVGISLIMAQAGLFVPAEEFTFCPYEKICIRIGNNDDLFNAHSSFVCEMKEANEIVKQANNKTLVLADEMCCSTEISSASTIVTSTLQWLDMKKSTYIFASHFFELLETCKNIKSLKVKHLKVNTINNSLVFERTLSDGPPDMRNYGTVVASKIFQDQLFLKMLKRNECEKKKKPIIKKSRYNKSDIRILCEVCGYQVTSDTDLPIDTHHIDFQCNANTSGFIGNFHKNVSSNLVSLCKICHIETHKGNINIRGWKTADNGVFLNYDKLTKPESI